MKSRKLWFVLAEIAATTLLAMLLYAGTSGAPEGERGMVLGPVFLLGLLGLPVAYLWGHAVDRDRARAPAPLPKTEAETGARRAAMADAFPATRNGGAARSGQDDASKGTG
jgi:hypothetical protein